MPLIMTNKGPVDAADFGYPTMAPQDAPYAPSKSDFIEMPFEWMKPVGKGSLQRSMSQLLERVVKMYPHLPQAYIANSINHGVTSYLDAMCSDNSNFGEYFGFDCREVVDSSPSKDQLSYSTFGMNDLSKILHNKLSEFFDKVGDQNA